MTQHTILACDDDPDILAALRIYLTGEGYRVLSAADGLEAVRLVRTETVHLVLLDVMMPNLDGIAAAERIRETSNLPILFLSARGEEADRVLGLHAGADDYIVKPFSPGELFARVRSALRRYTQLGGLPSGGAAGPGPVTAGSASGPGAGSVWRTGELVLDDERKTVVVEGREATLTPLEFGILRLLIAHPDRVYSSEQIYEAVWRDVALDPRRTVAVHVRHIREKIERDPARPRYLRVVYGLGYKVVSDP
ncbi:MAG: response regulator transcription factor [Salana multivorans]|uniref:response regulator transcription factor n=1 Tax=Salana multivorans TaxID=120377 RepID=UPI00095A75E6|nr:response regulator transcription factor [Salana multivorans]MBN8881166.1 response regulator transcription factor [Salana multivorans]OJX97951.1 MAG: DNA-binding response regulator [Micrococcales bacterium 73-15]